MTTTDTPSVMARLKEATAELHTRAERSPFQSRLVRGAVEPALYARWLSQMLQVHTELESRLRGVLARRPELASVVREDLFQAPRLRADLDALTPGAAYAEGDAARRMRADIARAAEANPLALLGFNYVLEGSKNGGRFIARGVRRSLSLEPGRGDLYLDPHGEQQPALWAQYRRDMDAIALSEADVEAMVAAACRMFEFAAEVGDDVLASHAS
jgi:heme oxygenase